MHKLRPTLPILGLLFAACLQVPAKATDVAIQGGTGGGPLRLECPANLYMTGVEINWGAWVTSIRGKCLAYDPATQRFRGAPQFTSRGGSPLPQVQTADCKDDQYISGIQIGFTRDGSNPKFLDYIQINCSDLADTNNPPAVSSRCLGTGSGCWQPYHPDGVRGLYFEQPCPAGEAANGLHGRFGGAVDALAPICAAKPSPVPSPPPVTVNEWLKEHNDRRAMHCVSPMTWSNELATAAQRWADACNLGANGVPCHQNDTQNCPAAQPDGRGENLYWSGWRSTPAGGEEPFGGVTPAEVVKAWYDEIANYNFNTPVLVGGSGPGVNGHFTQVVWMESVQLGCAQSLCRIQGHQRLLSVCKYVPQGNITGALIKNVLPKRNNCG